MELSAHSGEIAALATAGCWTVTALAFESAGKKVGSLAVNFIRLLIATVFLSIYCFVSRGLPLPTDASLDAWMWLALSGLVGFTVGDLCLFRAFVVLGARVSMLMMSLVPPITAVVGWLVMGETLGVTDQVGMALTVGGVAWVVMERKKGESGKKERIRFTGILLGLGAASGQAAGLVLSKKGMGDYDAFASTQIRILAGMVGFAAIFIIIRWWPKVGAAFRNRSAMSRISLGALFGPFLGVSLSLVAVKYTEAGVAATIMAIVPVLIIVPSALINKERVTIRSVIGAFVAVGGVGLMFFR